MHERFMIDLLADDCPLEVVYADRQRSLRQERSDHDLMRLDLFEIVEEEQELFLTQMLFERLR